MEPFDKEKNRPSPSDSSEKQEKDVTSSTLESATSFPSQEELEKEVGDYLARKYGGRVRVVSQMVFPGQAGVDGESDDSVTTRSSRGVHFDMKPEELEAWLDKYVVRQKEAKAVLSTKICTHFNKISYLEKKGNRPLPVGNIKNNVILIGPTGVGKTYLLKLIASKIGVPFVKGDATKFSETGYVGGDVEDLVRDLVKKADGDVRRASCGIVYIDEIDKIASTRGIHGPDVSRAGVQRALLKLLEETEVEIKPPHDPLSQIEAIEKYRKTGKREEKSVNTKNILFIVSGAFSDLSEIVKKRLCKSSMGFGAEVNGSDEQEWLSLITPQDLVEFGFENEFVGRLPVIATLNELSENDLYLILKNPESVVIVSKKQDFRSYGIDLRFEDAALRLLAKQAFKEQTGARALVSVVERALLPFEKKLPSMDVDQFLITEEMVRDPLGQLEEYVEKPFQPDLMKRFEAVLNHEKKELEAGIRKENPVSWQKEGIELTDYRIKLMASMCIKEDLSVDEVSARIIFWIKQIRNYEETFLHRCGISIHYDESAVDRLLDACKYDETSLYTHCERLSNIFEYGLGLVKENSGIDSFTINDQAVDNPEFFMNSLIKKSYRNREYAGDNEKG